MAFVKRWLWWRPRPRSRSVTSDSELMIAWRIFQPERHSRVRGSCLFSAGVGVGTNRNLDLCDRWTCFPKLLTKDLEMMGEVFLGRYRSERLLGEGGMGRVYLGHQVDNRRPVVIKVMHDRFASDVRFRQAFER